MIDWNVERLIDLACMADVTSQEIADEFGVCLSSVEKQLRKFRGEIEAAKKSINISERILIRVLDDWYDGATDAQIAVSTDLSLCTVRRLIRLAKMDEEATRDTGADDSLAALQAAFPNQFYEEDPRAAREYAGAPVFLLAADCVSPFSQERLAA